jgi:oxaloacetate decarboxylase gamma subunit
MSEFDIGVQRIVDGQGLAIAMAGMTIVFTALTLISTFIALLPGILKHLARLFPEAAPHVPQRVEPAPSQDLAAVAAAAGAFHEHGRAG